MTMTPLPQVAYLDLDRTHHYSLTHKFTICDVCDTYHIDHQQLERCCDPYIKCNLRFSRIVIKRKWLTDDLIHRRRISVSDTTRVRHGAINRFWRRMESWTAHAQIRENGMSLPPRSVLCLTRGEKPKIRYKTFVMSISTFNINSNCLDEACKTMLTHAHTRSDYKLFTHHDFHCDATRLVIHALP